ncbi:MAG: NYN domain-containing protein [Patescibacteria group bacterium]|nr:NYN domain-containing protein [Patescibacteria group bacterium]
MENIDQRVGLFVDVSNMYHSAKHLYKSKVNFGRILKEAVGRRKLIRAIAYVIKAKSLDEENFFEALAKQGFEIKAKDLQIFFGGQKKGDWDIGLTIDTIILADKLDTVVLVTGDGDFADLVKYLKINKGCFVEIMAFGESCSSKLKEEADRFIDLSKDKRKFLLSNRSRSKIKKRRRK